ncbi:MAG TPA: SurA N-terminal domain-containing protein [Elusimicrobiota bacterium]|nr:SurA N-terminal domain-containing protein [Elusimicrobiota bacterium]
MIGFLRRYQKSLFIISIGILLIGIFVGLGGYLLSSNDMSEAVASVGATKIPYSRFVASLNQYEDVLQNKGVNLSDDDIAKIKQDLLRDMIVNALLAQQAEKMGLKTTDEQLAIDIENTPAFQNNGSFNQDIYIQALQSIFHESPQQYETQRRTSLLAAQFKQMVYESAKLTPDEIKSAYAAAHKGSLRKFAKDERAFASQMQQQRALELINFYLRQIVPQVQIRTYLKQREEGT